MRRIVEHELTGRQLVAADVRLPKLLRDSPLPSLDLLVGQRVLGARRRAKVLVSDWSGGLSLMSHMMLAGQLAVIRPDGRRAVAGHPVPKPDGTYPHKATHAILTFDDGTLLHHSDIRQFGWMRLMPSEEVAAAIDAFGSAPRRLVRTESGSTISQPGSRGGESPSSRRFSIRRSWQASETSTWTRRSIARVFVHPVPRMP